MSHEAVAQAISAMGVEIVEIFGAILGTNRWAAGVVPFARIRRSGSEVDLILPSVLDTGDLDQSQLFRHALQSRPGLRPRLVGAAARLAATLDQSGIPWDWAAVRVRRTPEGGSRAAIELGRGAPPTQPLELLETPTVIPPPASTAEMQAPRPPRMPSFLQEVPSANGPPPRRRPSQPAPPPRPSQAPPHPAPQAGPLVQGFSPGFAQVSGQAGVIASPSLGQHELHQTMVRAQNLIGSKQEVFSKAIVGHQGTHLVPRDRSIEFLFSHGRVRSFGCDHMASFLPATGVWRWGWGNDDFTPIAKAQSRKLREVGGNWRLEAFSDAALKLPPESAYRLALTAAWVLGADACHFVRDENGGPEIVVAIYGVK